MGTHLDCMRMVRGLEIAIPSPGLKMDWQVYSKDGPFKSYGQGTSCEGAKPMSFAGVGHCTTGA